MRAPYISVMTSCYNSSRYLKEAIESILDQTFINYEFILINDGSKDHTLNIIREYAAKDARIVIIDKENTGLTDSLNVGLSRARGTWIARMDDDDISLPNRFEKQLNVISSSNDIILLGSGCITIDENGRELKRYTYPSEHKSFLSSIERGHSTFPHTSALFRLDVARKLNGYRRRMNGSEDLDLWLRLSAQGRIACIPEPLLKLRKHSESITAKNERLLILSTACVLSHLLRKDGLPDPVDGSEDNYLEFINFIEKRLVDEKAFEVQRLLSNLQNIYHSSGYRFEMAKTCISFKYKYDLIKQRLFRSMIYRDLYKDWLGNT